VNAEARNINGDSNNKEWQFPVILYLNYPKICKNQNSKKAKPFLISK
jgi:hypothetical protein